MKYLYEIFEVSDFEEAKNCVLTPDPSNPNKFNEQTEYLINAIDSLNIISDNKVVLDFGVGMGRVSKRLIEKFNCNVIGCDISINMLKLATMYVNNTNKFVTCNKVNIKGLVDVIISAFVLQHVQDPETEINHLIDILMPNGYFILLDDPQSRFVPTTVDPTDKYVNWHDDGYKISEKFDKHLTRVTELNYCDNYHKIIVYKKS